MSKPIKSDPWLDSNGKGWRRNHIKMRDSLFTPMKASKGPKDISQVGDIRITVGTTLKGRVFQCRDVWKTLEDPHQRVEPFIGQTHFIHLSDAICESLS